MEQTRPKTRTELQQQRRQQLRVFSNDFMEQYYKSHPYIHESSVPIVPPAPPFPSNYIFNPHVRTKTELDLLRKTQSITENQKFHNRSSSNPQNPNQTFTIFSQSVKIKKKSEKIKEEAVKLYSEHFCKRLIGVHGEELPKFSEHLKDYWKVKEGYVEKPVVCGKKQESRPISEFCRLRVKYSSVDSQITAKPGEVNPFPSFVPKEVESAGMRTTSRSRFSEELLMSSRNGSLGSIEIGDTIQINKKKKRPFTANCQNSRFKKVIRSSGFL